MTAYRIPPHIAWPLVIVGLLSLSVVASLLTVFAARSDGGAQVIDDYYHKAATWDSTRALQTSSDALGWQVELTAGSSEGLSRSVFVHIQNQAGEPVTGLHGTIHAFRPNQSQEIDQTVLVEAEPGIYQQRLTMPHKGLWDFEIKATRVDATSHSVGFLKRIRLEVTQ